MKNWFKKLLAIVLCVATVLPCFSFMTLITFAAGADSASASSEGITTSGLKYKATGTTTYIGNRVYKLDYSVSLDMSDVEKPETRRYAQNGHYTVPKNGYYLIELWGGKGGDGQDMTFPLAIPPVMITRKGGDGGSAGYVRALVYLEEGQELLYSVGTNGDYSTRFEDEGAGENGSGGTHGESGSFKVGGGGGFSAVYLFESSEYKTSWISNGEVNLPKDKHDNNYIMIAGGGGGGGAGNQLLFEQEGVADGGKGGNVFDSPICISGDNYPVDGYVFAGGDGKTSGIYTDYVGKGAGTLPGEDPATVLGWWDASSAANDWPGAANPEIAPGHGGAGNFRGGGGGSGYCGGTGGIMESAGIAKDVGGGGGGSSFIASDVNGKEVTFNGFSDAVSKYLCGWSNCPSSTGGGMAITLVGYENTETDIAANLGSTLSFTGSINKFFEILPASKPEKGTLSYQNGASGSISEFTYSNIPVNIGSANNAGEAAHVTLFIRARDEYFGGNNVSIFNSRCTFKIKNDSNKYDVPYSSDTNNVNVPVSYKLQTYSSHSSEPVKTLIKHLLDMTVLTAIKTSVSNNGSDWRYTDVKSIGGISAKNVATGAVYDESDSITITETSTFLIKCAITFKGTTPAKVGPAVENMTLTGYATHTILAPDTGILHGLTVTGQKSLDWQEGAYLFECNSSVYSNSLLVPKCTQSGEGGVGSGRTKSVFTALEAGWYFVNIHGGDGGSAGEARLTNTNGKGTPRSDHYENAYNGGEGYDVSGLVYLEVGESLTFYIGAAGASGENVNLDCPDGDYQYCVSGTSGSGGTSTYVENDAGDIIAIAGAGGGGAGHAVSGRTHSTSESFNILTTKTSTGARGGGNLDKQIFNYPVMDSPSVAAGNGGNGTVTGVSVSNPTALIGYKVNFTKGTAGTAGKCYVAPGFADGTVCGERLFRMQMKIQQDIFARNSVESTKSGSYYVSLVATPETVEAEESVLGLEISGKISRYFTPSVIDADVGMDVFNGATDSPCYAIRRKATQDDGSVLVTFDYCEGKDKINLYRIGQYKYKITENPDKTYSFRIYDMDFITAINQTTVAGGIEYVFSFDSSYTISATPREGFAGGNDVPFLAEGIPLTLSLKGDTLDLETHMASDYANVRVAEFPEDRISPKDVTVPIGSTLNYEDLYDWEGLYSDPEDAWKYEYVTAELPVGEIPKTYNMSCDEEIIAILKPTVEVPLTPDGNHAVTINGSTSAELPIISHVTVNVDVLTSLTHMVYSGPTVTEYQKSFTCTLLPESGYIAPVSIKVYRNGVALSASNYTYSVGTGELTFNSSCVTYNLLIEAEATPVEYTLHYQYDVYDEGTGEITRYTEEERYYADDPIDFTFFDSLVIPERTGYIYYWEWETDDAAQPTLMPAHDVYVTGTYMTEPYLLRVKYEDAEGNPMRDGNGDPISDFTELHIVGDNFSIASPAVPGYLARVLVAEGTVNAESIALYNATETHELILTVVYDRSHNTLTVVYEKPDGSSETESHTLTAGDPFEITPTLTVPGYHPVPAVVTGTMPENGDSMTVYVSFEPDTYEVDFVYQYELGTYPGYENLDFSSAVLNGASGYLLSFGKTYGYNAATESYGGLPAPAAAGYKFIGWYTDPTFTDESLVTERTVLTEVPAGTPVVLYARYAVETFDIVIRYAVSAAEGDYAADLSLLDLDDGKMYKTYQFYYGETYDIPLTQLTGYYIYADYGTSSSRRIDSVSGIMPGQNIIVDVTYVIRTVDVVFRIPKEAEYYNFSDAATATTACDRSTSLPSTKKTVKYGKPLKVAPFSTNTDPATIFTAAANGLYIYTFTGWKDALGNEFAADAITNVIDFSVVTAAPAGMDTVYIYATYDAQEAIAQVMLNNTASTIVNFADLGVATAYAQEKWSDNSVKFTIHRNPGNPQEIYGNVELFGPEVTTLQSMSFVLDADLIADGTHGTDPSFGVRIIGTENAGVQVSSPVTTRKIVTASDADTVAMDLAGWVTSISSGISFEAHSENGNAIGIRVHGVVNASPNTLMYPKLMNVSSVHGDATLIHMINAISYVYTCDGSVWEVEAPEGTATVLRCEHTEDWTLAGTDTLHVGYESSTISADGKIAYLAYWNDNNAISAEVGMTNGAEKSTVTITGQTKAYGIYSDANTTILYGSTGILDVTATEGEAYGIYTGVGKTLTVNYSMPKLTVTAPCNATGIFAQGPMNLGSGGGIAYATAISTGTGDAVACRCMAGATIGSAGFSAAAVNGDAVAFWNSGAKAELAPKLSAVSENGNAVGIRNVGFSLTAKYMSGYNDISVYAIDGTGSAVGIDNAGAKLILKSQQRVTANATGGDAIGIRSDSAVSSEYNLIVSAVSEEADAVGIRIENGNLSITYDVSYNSTKVEVTAYGAATGILVLNNDTASSLPDYMTVTANAVTGNAVAVNVTGPLNVKNNATISAASEEADAIAVTVRDGYLNGTANCTVTATGGCNAHGVKMVKTAEVDCRLDFTYSLSVTVNAGSGTAVGLETFDTVQTTYSFNCNVTSAEGKATGISAGSLTIKPYSTGSTSYPSTVSAIGKTEATGIWSLEGSASLSNGITVNAETNTGNAIAIYSYGAVEMKTYPKIKATSKEGNAIGVITENADVSADYNGIFTVSGAGFATGIWIVKTAETVCSVTLSDSTNVNVNAVNGDATGIIGGSVTIGYKHTLTVTSEGADALGISATGGNVQINPYSAGSTSSDYLSKVTVTGDMDATAISASGTVTLPQYVTVKAEAVSGNATGIVGSGVTIGFRFALTVTSEGADALGISATDGNVEINTYSTTSTSSSYRSDVTVTGGVGATGISASGTVTLPRYLIVNAKAGSGNAMGIIGNDVMADFGLTLTATSTGADALGISATEGNVQIKAYSTTSTSYLSTVTVTGGGAATGISASGTINLPQCLTMKAEAGNGKATGIIGNDVMADFALTLTATSTGADAIGILATGGDLQITDNSSYFTNVTVTGGGAATGISAFGTVTLPYRMTLQAEAGSGNAVGVSGSAVTFGYGLNLTVTSESADATGVSTTEGNVQINAYSTTSTSYPSTVTVTGGGAATGISATGAVILPQQTTVQAEAGSGKATGIVGSAVTADFKLVLTVTSESADALGISATEGNVQINAYSTTTTSYLSTVTVTGGVGATGISASDTVTLPFMITVQVKASSGNAVGITGGAVASDYSLRLTVTSTGADATGISATEGNVQIEAYADSTSSTYLSTVTVTGGGAATGIKVVGDGTVTLPYRMTVKAEAGSGNATGIDCTDATVTVGYGFTVNATSTSADAMGISVTEGDLQILDDDSYFTEVLVTGGGAATGIEVVEGTVVLPKKMTVIVTAGSDNATGIDCTDSTVTVEYGLTVNATSEGKNAIGIDNKGSTIILKEGTRYLTVDATTAAAEGVGIGIRSAGGSVNSDAEDGYLRSGRVRGTTYGIFCVGNDASVHVSSSDLYAKGKDADSAFVGCDIESGHDDYDVPDQTNWPGYRFIALEYYTFTFINKDPEGVIHGDPVVLQYKPSWTSMETPELAQTYTGYTITWPALIFDFPESGTNVDIYAIYTINTYVFTYVLNGGTLGETTGSLVIEADYKSDVKKSDPTMIGHTFGGWFLDDGTWANGYTPDLMPAENLTVYAKWIINQYTISFVTGCDPEYPDITQDYATSIGTVAAPTRIGYRFDGWRKNTADGEVYTIPSSMPAENVTAVASWILIEYSYRLFIPITVNFHTNYDPDTVQTFVLGGSTELFDVSDVTTPSRGNNYIFTGWWSNATERTDSTYCNIYDPTFNFRSLDTDNDNVVDLYAGWLSPASDSTSREMSTTSVSVSITNASYPYGGSKYVYYWYFCPTAGKYTFSLVNSSSSTSYRKTAYFYTLSRSATFTKNQATVKYNSSSYTVMYFLGTRSIEYDCQTPGTVFVIAVKNDSYEKDTGKTDCDGNKKTETTACSTSTVSTSLTGKPSSANLISTAGVLGIYTIEDGVVALPEMTPPEKYLFLGWSEKNGDTYTGDKLFNLTSDLITSRKVWKDYDGTGDPLDYSLNLFNVFEGIPITVSYDTKGGNSFAPVTKPYETALPLPTPTRDEYTFVYWYVDDMTVQYTATTVPGEDITLHALWKSDTMIWHGSVVTGMRFDSDFADSDTATLRTDGTVTMHFNATKELIYKDPALVFSQGLLKGTLLSLADISGDIPVYYEYTVTEEKITELKLSKFKPMAVESTEGYDCASRNLLISICYLNAPATGSETVTFQTKDDPEDLILTLNFVGTVVTERQTLESATVDKGGIKVTVPVPSLVGQGFSPGDSVYLRARAKKNAFKAGVELYGNGQTSVYCDDGTVILPLGTVADYSGAETVNAALTLNLSTTDLSKVDDTVEYDVIVLPEGTDVSGGSYSGKLASTVAAFSQSVSGKLRVNGGNTTIWRNINYVNVIVAKDYGDQKVTARLLQAVRDPETGAVTLEVTENCLTAIMDAYGDVYTVDPTDGTVIKNGSSDLVGTDDFYFDRETVKPGVYYLVVTGEDFSRTTAYVLH